MFSDPRDPPALAGAVGSFPKDPCPEAVVTTGGLTLPIAAGLGGIPGAGLVVGGLATAPVGAGLIAPVGGLAAGGRAPKGGRGAAGGLAAFGGGLVPGGIGRAAVAAGGRAAPGGLVVGIGRGT